MKKKQMKSKVEARKSVENQCDYSRMNGKCGRALCENFGKPCPGRTCEDWKCDAEGSGDRNVAAPTAVAVVEPKNAVAYSDQDVAAGITRQLQVIEDAEKNAALERVKLGVVLIRWEQYLGEGRGRGKSGGGLEGWLKANVPALSYRTAQNYKYQAKQAVEMLGGGARAQAVLMDETTVTQPDGEVIEIEAEYIEKRDNLFNEVKSRRELEQTYFKFMASEGKGKPGRKAGSREQGTGNGEQGRVKVRSLLEMALLYAEPICTALKKPVTHSTVKDLQGWDRGLLEEYVANVEQYLKELKEVLKAR